MLIRDGLYQLLLLIYSGLIIVIAAFMFLAFPIGAYTVFNTDIDNLTYQYKLDTLNIELGEYFIILWCIYLSLFSILLFKEREFTHSLILAVKKQTNPEYNKLAMIIVWFSILLVGSKAIDYIQQLFGIEIGEIKEDSLLLKFLNLTIAPLNEEFVFRAVLIGIPIYLFINKRYGIKEFVNIILRPNIIKSKKVIILIIISAIIFGSLHVLTGWDYGKLTQSTFAGIILGYVYYRFGLHSSIMLHWSTNYFLTSYGLFTYAIFDYPWNDLANNPLLAWLDLLLTFIAIIGIALYIKRLIKRRESNELNLV